MAAPKKKTADEVVEDKSDVKGHNDGKYRKTFVLQGLRIDLDRDAEGNSKSFDEFDETHRANKDATLQEAINKGLHPKAQAELESGPDLVHSGLNSTSYSYTYAVACVPAAIDLDPDSTVTPLDNEDGKRERAKLAKLRAAGDPAGFAE